MEAHREAGAAPAGRPGGGAGLREGLHPHPGLLRGGLLPAGRLGDDALPARHAARPRGAHPRHRPRALPLPRRAGGEDLRARQAGGHGPLGHRPGGERPHRRLPPLPGAGRSHDRRRAPGAGPGLARRARGGLGGRRQQHGQQLARGRHPPRVRAARGLPAGLRPRPRAPAARRGQGARRGEPRRGHAGRTCREHRRLGQHGAGGRGRGAPEGLPRLHRRSQGDGARRPGRHRPPLPPRPSGGGDRGGGAGRAPVRRLRRGREPAPRPEGTPRVPPRASGDRPWR